MTEQEQICREQILSEDYLDFIVENNILSPQIFIDYGDHCTEFVNNVYGVAHLERGRAPFYNVGIYGYQTIPSLFSLADTTSMEVSGILRAHNRPIPNLRGDGVLIGIIDTGIDYTHPVFRMGSGESRILGIWDQTDQTGEPPSGILYGTEFRRDQINDALRLSNPRELVPTTDESGHGTFLAGIAAGGETPDGSFVGAAPETELAVVKLKPAKQNLREFFYTPPEAEVYQETDIMMGVRYLLNLQEEFRIPMVILIGLQTNRGGHDGFTPLEELLSRQVDLKGLVPVVATGNDGNRGHHYFGSVQSEETYQDVEIRVPSGVEGFWLDLWAQSPELYSVGFVSPGGEEIPRIPPRTGSSENLGFVLEETTVSVNYRIVTARSGSQLISMGFRRPTPGIWIVRIYSTYAVSGQFHMWLPVEGQIKTGIQFLEPNPNITLTIPSTSSEAMAVSAYNHKSDSIYIHSGRGFTRFGAIKPDLAAPGVSVYGPAPGGRFTTMTGTSVAAAHVAGAAADILSWGIYRGNDPTMDSNTVRAYLIRGARRKNVYTYPNREWGFGALDLYGVFELLKLT